MSVYDKAYTLAKALASSPEYLQYLDTKEELEKDPANLSILQNFRRQQWEVQMAEILGQEVEEQITQELEKLYAFLSANPAVNEFLTAEYRLSRIISDVQKIIGEALGVWVQEGNQNRTVN